MTNKIQIIKNLIKQECKKNNLEWFYDIHLLAVEKFSNKLLKKLPKANREIVFLGVWLHDLHRIKKLKGDHAKVGAREAEKLLIKHKYNTEIIEHVKHLILAHRCKMGGVMPKTLEAKILSSADAMSHYVNDLYILIATLGERNVSEFKKWALEKLERDYTRKIQFDFARKMIKDRHDALKYIFTMK